MKQRAQVAKPRKDMDLLVPEIPAGVADMAPRGAFQMNHLSKLAGLLSCFYQQRSGTQTQTSWENDLVLAANKIWRH